MINTAFSITSINSQDPIVDFNCVVAITVSIGPIGGARLGTYIKRKIRPVYIKVAFMIVLVTIITRVILDLAGVL